MRSFRSTVVAIRLFKLASRRSVELDLVDHPCLLFQFFIRVLNLLPPWFFDLLGHESILVQSIDENPDRLEISKRSEE